MIALLNILLDDKQLERVRRNFFDAIAELQASIFGRARVIQDIRLQDGVPTTIPHQLGRPAIWMRESCIRGGNAGGRIEEIRDGSVDRSKYIQLRATGFASPIYIDLLVV